MNSCLCHKRWLLSLEKRFNLVLKLYVDHPLWIYFCIYLALHTLLCQSRRNIVCILLANFLLIIHEIDNYIWIIKVRKVFVVIFKWHDFEAIWFFNYFLSYSNFVNFLSCLMHFICIIKWKQLCDLKIILL